MSKRFLMCKQSSLSSSLMIFWRRYPTLEPHAFDLEKYWMKPLTKQHNSSFGTSFQLNSFHSKSIIIILDEAINKTTRLKFWNDLCLCDWL